QGKGTELGMANLMILFMMLANKLGWLDRVKKKIPKKRKNGNDTVIGKLAANPRNPGNPNGKPGKAQICIENGKLLTELKGKSESQAEQINENKEAIETVRTENRDDHKTMFEKIDRIK
ncbi:MAG: hypothetical protein KAR20_16770, partial [Candidatus Heimdallarchaeota archaeon]|nr:hypothetical protein [Candidatus Heimdallarchaeota archaeon]